MRLAHSSTDGGRDRMNRVMTAVLISVLVVTVGSVAAACGDNGDELTLEEYFSQVETYMDDLAERVSIEAFTQPDIDAPLEEQREIFSGFWTTFSEQVGGVFLDDLDALDPPSEAQDAHNELLQAAKDFAANAADVVEALGNATSEEEFDEAFALLDRGGDLGLGCEKLQEVADDNDIQVTLNCKLE